jgi:hypothetical protein
MNNKSLFLLTGLFESLFQQTITLMPELLEVGRDFLPGFPVYIEFSQVLPEHKSLSTHTKE